MNVLDSFNLKINESYAIILKKERQRKHKECFLVNSSRKKSTSPRGFFASKIVVSSYFPYRPFDWELANFLFFIFFLLVY